MIQYQPSFEEAHDELRNIQFAIRRNQASSIEADAALTELRNERERVLNSIMLDERDRIELELQGDALHREQTRLQALVKKLATEPRSTEQ